MKKENYNKRNGVIKLIIQKSDETFELGDFVEGVINFKGEKVKEVKVLEEKSNKSNVLEPKVGKVGKLEEFWE